ncbi:protein of unknown function [Micromonospora rhizosphaerae]|uniref:DUF4192 domain-containing protein n=1 Tax=Micromonospora rhizosphaerae TaxID=568872 RepID=A0A1C6S8J4_9ACTN|nr:DUF4192 domain-containing protein [Micromonospora rhizosphaerae]SCL25796.1 protein of unknown function [Micromonospora rhizosphaerae]
MVAPRKLRLTSREDIVVAVPYLLGFHPQDSLVCVVLDNQRIRFVARLDLPQPSEGHQLSAPAAQTAAMISQYGSAAILVGYGPADRVEPAAEVLTTALLAAHVDVLEVLRVDEGRYWCLCGDTNCADGVAYNAAASNFPAEAVYLGIAPLPDRAALERLISPVTGPERDRIRAATYTALRRLTDMIDSGGVSTAGSQQQPSPPEHVVRSGIAAVQQAYESAARGETLSDDVVAWLAAVLMVPQVRDHAWTTCDGSDEQRRLWIDVTRRATPGTSAAPACLLAVTAYLAGDGALANIAVDRSLRADPNYHLAQLLGHALQAGVPPDLWQAATTGKTAD